MSVLFAKCINSIVFSLLYLNDAEREACVKNRSLLYSLHSRAIAVLLYMITTSSILFYISVCVFQFDVAGSLIFDVMLSYCMISILIGCFVEQRRGQQGTPAHFRVIQILMIALMCIGLLFQLPRIYSDDIKAVAVSQIKQANQNTKELLIKRIDENSSLRAELKKYSDELDGVNSQLAILFKSRKYLITYRNGKEAWVYSSKVKRQINKLNQRAGVLQKQMAEIDDQLNKSPDDAMMKRLDRIDSEETNVKVTTLQSVDQVLLFARSLSGCILLAVTLLIAGLLDLLILYLTSRPIAYASVWSRINSADEAQFLIAYAKDDSKKIRYYLP